MKRIRVIPVLLLSGGGMVKTRKFVKPQYLGDPINAVKIFNEKQADELVLLDIDATANGRIEFQWIEEIISEAFMPIAYGGGIRTLDQCVELFRRGVEKVVINTALVERPEIIAQVSDRFGAQSVVASIDARQNLWKRWKVYVKGSRRETKFSPVELARECERLGAGEIFLTAADREGEFGGYDLELVKSVSDAVGLPVVANGGAGQISHFLGAVEAGGAAVAAGSMFVFAAKSQGMLISYPSQSELREQFWSRIP